jgi:hypothetical protein
LANDSATGFRLTVWRPYQPTNEIAFDDGVAIKYIGIDDDGEVQQNIFMWQIKEDVWGGIKDDELRTTLKDRMFSDFSPFKSPIERGMSKFGEFLKDLENTTKTPNSIWSLSSQETADDIPMPVNLILALYHQFRWIHQVFKNIPDASVTVR